MSGYFEPRTALNTAFRVKFDHAHARCGREGGRHVTRGRSPCRQRPAFQVARTCHSGILSQEATIRRLTTSPAPPRTSPSNEPPQSLERLTEAPEEEAPTTINDQ